MAFITLEGGEGAGKSTQLTMLKKWLAEQSIDVVYTREPGGTEGAEAIRDLLVTGDPDRWDDVTEALLYMAARRDNLRTNIWPALEQKKWVIADRYVDSTIAYQGYGHGGNIQTLWDIYKIVAGDFMPDLTIYLDIDPEIGLARTSGRDGKEAKENRFESIDIGFHKRLRAGYLTMAEQDRDRYVVIDTNQSINAVQNDMRQAIERKFLSP